MSGWVAGAVVVGGVASAAIGASAAQSAADTQAAAAQNAAQASLQATNNSNALQWEMYQQQLINQSPYMQGGQEAYAALLGGMGLGVPQAGLPAQNTAAPVDNGTSNTQPVNTTPGGGTSTSNYAPTPGGGVQQIMGVANNPGTATTQGVVATP